MAEKQIKIEVLLDDKNLSSGLKTIKSDLNNVSSNSFSGLQQGANNASVAVGALKASIVGAVAGLSLGSVIDEFTRLENAGLELTKMTDGLFSADFQKRADEISKAFGKSKAAILETASGASALGVAEDDLFNFTNSIIGGAIALTEYKDKSEDLAREVAGVSLQMNLAAKDTNKYLSVLNSVGDDSAASAKDISLFNERTASTGKALGLTIPELSAIGATFRDLGRPVEVAATAFNAYSSALLDTQKIAENLNRVDPTKSVQEYNDRIQALKKEDPVGLFVEISSSLDDLGRQNIFGRQFADEFTAIGGATEKLQSNISNANKAFEEGTSVLKELEIQQTSLSSSLDRMKVKLIEIATSIGSLLAPIIKGLEPIITGVANKILLFQELLKSPAFTAFRDVISSIISTFDTPFVREFFANFSTLAVYIGGAVAVFLAIQTAIGGVATAFGILSATIVANPIIAAIVAIIAVIALLKAAWDSNFLGIRDSLVAFYTYIVETFNSISTVITTTLDNISLYITDTLASISSSFTSTFDTIYSIVSTVLDSVYTFVSSIIDSITNYINTGVSNISDTFTNTFTNIFNTVSTILTSIYDFIVNIIGSIIDFIANTDATSAFVSMFSGIAGVVEDIFNNIVSIITDKINSVIDGIKKVGSFIRNIGANGLDSLGNILDSFGGFRAEGGKVNKGVPYVVGEKGAELFIPNQNGTIIPNSSLVNNTTNNGAPNITININGAGVQDPYELARLVQDRLLYSLKTRRYA